MAVMTHAKFHFSRVMITLIFGIWASELHNSVLEDVKLCNCRSKASFDTVRVVQ